MLGLQIMVLRRTLGTEIWLRGPRFRCKVNEWFFVLVCEKERGDGAGQVKVIPIIKHRRCSAQLHLAMVTNFIL